ncbi:MAG: ABC transporter permease subunit, partial [Ruthenibacterium sp.]
MKKSKTATASKMTFMQLLRRDHQLVIMSLPMILFFFVFAYIPMAGLTLAFVDYKPALGIFGSPFAGLKYFQQVFTNPFFPRLLRNTFMIGFETLVWSFPFPILFALAVNEMRSAKAKKLVQTISYMPYFISVVVIVGLMANFLSPTTGIVNYFYTAITGNDAVNFMADPKYFRFLYVASHVWQTFGWNSIIYLAALAGVDTALYDSARVDGANRLQQLLYIT